MAKLCTVCGCLCAYFLLFFRIIPVSSVDGYHFYNSGDKNSGSGYHFARKLLDDEEELQLTSITDDENNQSNSPISNDRLLYYTSTVRTDPEAGQHYWVELRNCSDANVNTLLSRSFRQKTRVQLSFEFPFYGHFIKSLTITTGGFLYTGDDDLLSWIATTQYIAPLMANFDNTISNNSYIRYVDNGTAFTVEWEKVLLKDRPGAGEFTFQTTLHKNGDIIFVYRKVPLFIENMDDQQVKVGVSDAYIIDRPTFSFRTKTIREYSRLSFTKEDIKNWTTIYLKALPTCLRNQNCASCIASNIFSVPCFWCVSIQRCSNGLGRGRQDWLANRCEEEKITKESLCPDVSNENNVMNEEHTSELQAEPQPLHHNHNSEVDGMGDEHDTLANSVDSGYHSVRRRDVQNNQSNSPLQSNKLPLSNDTSGTENHTENIAASVSMVNKSSTDNKIFASKTKLEKNAKVFLPSITNNGPHNLGVNGSGQYMNITSTKPQLEINVSSVSVNQDTTVLNNNTEEDITINNCPTDDDSSDAFNRTLTEHNVTITKKDNHMYYNSTVRTDPEAGHYYWIDLANRPDAKVNEMLSKSHRRAATVQLSFEFPFYGHLIKNVTIATGGFLYTGDYVHSWLAATQYIAPLMANFDTSISNDSYIRYLDNGTAFTVEWQNVALKDRPDVGEFTFQTTLHKNGDIIFVYQNVPLYIKNIDDDQHPVKVGLSDAYIIDRTIFLVRRKTIYEYHRINFKEEIKNWTVIYLTALPTCLQNEDCIACTTSNIPFFDCQWCPSVNRCSNGVDRNRQDWLTKGCEKQYTTNESLCSHISGADIFDDSNITYVHDRSQFQHQMEEGYSKPNKMYNSRGAGSTRSVKMGVSSIVAILFLVGMVAGLAVWLLYAYRNPHTTSGQILIRYRPSQWRWRRGEARYTAATIHM